MYNKFMLVAILLLIVMYLFKCKASGNYTGREYMPDMAHSRAYDVYVDGPGTRTKILRESGDQQLDYQLFADGKVARKPVAGTVPRGQKPYPFPNTEQGYEQAASYENPYWDADKKILEEGKQHYTVYCAVCHGEKGQGQGSISAAAGGPYGGIPNYFGDAYIQMPEGKMFHSMHYGKADMGSYASQLSKDERWKVVAYIKSLQADYAKSSKGLPSDEAALAYVRGKNLALSPTGEPIVSELESMKTTKLKVGDKFVLKNIFFDTGSAGLKTESYYELDLLQNILNNNADSKVEISGHTDSDGVPENNLTLSENRSQAAYQYLISKGVSEEQITFKGYGQDRPVAPNDTPENKQQNRRVEFEVIE